MEIGDNSAKYYAKEFEKSKIKATAMFYSQKALNWIASETYENYMLKVLPTLREKQNEFMLRELVKRWSNHKIMVRHTELNGKIRDAVISLIDQEREGEEIDRALLKNVLDMFVEIGMGQMDYFENDFEEAMLKDTAAYYSRKASNRVLEDSCPDYMLKAEECLK